MDILLCPGGITRQESVEDSIYNDDPIHLHCVRCLEDDGVWGNRRPLPVAHHLPY